MLVRHWFYRTAAEAFTLHCRYLGSKMQLVDIGANLGHPHFKKDLDAVLQRAKDAGICKILVTGTSVKISKEAKVLAQQHPGFLYFTAGIHPHDAKDFVEGTSLTQLTALVDSAQCVAVGECGLDFNRNFSPPDAQRRAFDAQVGLACKTRGVGGRRKALFVHEREASADLLAILDAHADLPPVVVHCFTGTADEARTYVDRGFYVGLTGYLWKDRLPDGVQHALKTGVIPLDRLLIETDAPFMYPNIVKNKKLPDALRCVALSETATTLLRDHCSFKRNEPCSLLATCEMIAALVGVTPHEVAEKTTENATKVFGLCDSA